MTQSQQNYHYFNYSFELFNSLSVEELDAQNDWAVYWIMFNGARHSWLLLCIVLKFDRANSTRSNLDLSFLFHLMYSYKLVQPWHSYSKVILLCIQFVKTRFSYKFFSYPTVWYIHVWSFQLYIGLQNFICLITRGFGSRQIGM